MNYRLVSNSAGRVPSYSKAATMPSVYLTAVTITDGCVYTA